jgi:hypothetical protein
MPSGDGGVCDIQSSEDYDDVRSGDDRSNANVRNGNDDDRDDNVKNGNDEEAPNNVVVGADVKVVLPGQQNDIHGESEEVLVQQGPEINIPKGLNENLDQETAPQLEGATNLEDEMQLDGIFRPCVYHRPPPIGPTLVTLDNARRNAVRRLP